MTHLPAAVTHLAAAAAGAALGVFAATYIGIRRVDRHLAQLAKTPPPVVDAATIERILDRCTPPANIVPISRWTHPSIRGRKPPA